MRYILAIMICCFLAGGALAGKQTHPNQAVPRVPCELLVTTYDWDFAVADHGFTTTGCDAAGEAAWEFGSTSYVPGAPGTVWGTILEANYPTDAGQALLTPAFLVDGLANLMEIHHYYDIENLWDGGNVTVDGQVINPMAGYPGIVSVPSDWYAWCVDFEEAFTGLSGTWVTSCFDLSPFEGQTIQVSFEFGSDDSFTFAGWYLASVKIGSNSLTPADEHNWSVIKNLYR